jgi:hypothetical protein
MVKKKGVFKSGFWKSNILSWLFRTAKTNKPKKPEHWQIVLGVLGLALTLGIYVHETSKSASNNSLDLDPSPNSKFVCEERANPVIGGEDWTVVYRRGERDEQLWLRMVREMGDGWTTEARCQEIANRMNEYKAGGLEYLAIRDDANTPNQKVICAITQLTPKACPPVLTLMPEDDADETLYKVMGALQLGQDAVLQCSDADACPTEVQYRVSVRHRLTWGD